MQIKTGDGVKHHPSGETWTVAYADYENDRLAWCGWPPGLARISDCELIESCSDVERMELLSKMAAMRGDDHRKSWALRELARVETG